MALTPSAATTLGLVFEGILYGAYVVLFILYLILWRRNDRGVGRPLTLAQILLFSLCTLSLCLDITCGYFSAAPSAAFDTGSLAIFAVTDYLAQMILLYRCWIVWGKRWAVVAVPGFLALVTFAGGLTLTALDNSPLWSTDQEKISRLFRSTRITTYSISLAANALTTSLIVTKIFLTSRKTRPALGSNSHRSLHIAAATMIESGLLMFAFQLVFIVLFLRGPEFYIVSCMTTQIYGITPTLLNIRVVMGSTLDKATEETLSLRFIHSGGTASQTTDLSMGTAGVQPQGIHIELNDISDSKGAADDVV